MVATILGSLSPAAPPGERHRRALAFLRDGDFAAAVAEAHAGWKDRLPSEWYWRFRLLEAEAVVERNRGTEGLAVLETGSNATSAEFEIRRRVLSARHFLLQPKSSPSMVCELLDEARRLAEQNGRPDLEPEIDIRFAQLLIVQKQFTLAQATLEKAGRAAERAGNVWMVASAFNNAGYAWIRQSRFDEAIPPLTRAQQLFHDVGANQSAATAGNNLVLCYSRLGDFDKALYYSQEALRLTRPSTQLSRALGETGTLYLNQEQPEKAIPYYRQARDLARKFGALPDAARWAGNLTLALTEIGDWDGAEQALHEAHDLGPESSSQVYLSIDRADIARGRNRLADARAIYEQVIASNPGEASVKWAAYAGIARTRAAEGDATGANRNFEAAIQVIERSQSDLSGNDNKITFLSRLNGFYQDYVDALMSQNQPVKALAVADSSRARVLSERFGTSLPPAAPRLEEEFRAIARKSGSVWLSYWLAPHRSYLWVTTPKEVRPFTLNSSLSEIAGLVEEYRGFVEGIRNPLLEENEAGRKLYDILVAPAAEMLQHEKSVIVVPDGPLHQLSFATLPVYGGEHGHYWIEDIAVSIAPSFGVFQGQRERPRAALQTLIVGNPVSPNPSFPPLEFAAGEIATVDKHLSPGVTKIVAEEARPEIWKQRNPGSFDIIHFTAHAEANRQSPLDSAIILSRGNGFRLFARDIIDVPLRASLVTLSACRSSGARSYAGEGLVGLTWAFLQAGSRHVVAGLWDVADQSSTLLMDSFYKGIAAGTAPSEALRTAQIELIHTAYAKPFYWGPFQCYGR